MISTLRIDAFDDDLIRILPANKGNHELDLYLDEKELKKLPSSYLEINRLAIKASHRKTIAIYRVLITTTDVDALIVPFKIGTMKYYLDDAGTNIMACYKGIRICREKIKYRQSML